MRDINQKASDTDKQIAIAPSAVPKPFALRRSVWLSNLNTKRAISTGGLSIFAVAALLGIKPAQANITDQSPSLPNQTAEEEQAIPTNSQSSSLEVQAEFPQARALGEFNKTASQNVQTLAAHSSNKPPSELLNLNAQNSSVVLTSSTDAPSVATAARLPTAPPKGLAQSQSLSTKDDAAPALNQGQPGQADFAPTQLSKAFALRRGAQQVQRASGSRIPAFTSSSLTPVGAGLAVIPEIENNGTNTKPAPTEYNFAPSAQELGNFSSLQPQPSTEEAVNAVPRANSLSFAKDGKTAQNSNNHAILTEYSKPATVTSASVPPSTEEAPTLDPVESKVGELSGTQTLQPSTILPGFKAGTTAFSSTLDAVEYKVWDSIAKGKQPTTILPTVALRNPSAPTLNPALGRVPKSMAGVAQPTRVAQAIAPNATAATSEPYSGPGAARLLGGTIQAQSSIDAAQEAQSKNAAQTNNPLAPSLVFQGGFITQDETGARARLTGLYPVSPNLLFGGTVDLTTGEGFSDTAGTGLDLTELYVTTSLPSYPNLRLTAGLVDLTSYFDRNSFAKDSLTHFFNPVFQTNPALARTGIGSRPAVLLNWDITDNINARVAGFSSSRSLGDLAPDGFAGELAYRFDNGIIRATYATDRDAQKNGFKEIYGIPRGDGSFGPRSGDRESSYGINAEYYIPEIKMGLFGRYGHYENTSMGRGGETYSAGLNFLDLFMKNDRLGFGYGRDLSSDSLRRATKAKVPDVWELFYDFRITPYLRAGVTLQARDQFSDIVAGVRVKTEFDLLGIGRIFK